MIIHLGDVKALTLLTVIASETEWAVARGGALARISRRRISRDSMLARPALTAVLATARTDAVQEYLQDIFKFNGNLLTFHNIEC